MGKKVEVSYNPQLGYLQTIFHHNFDFLTGIKSYTERTDGVEFVVDTYKENTVKVFIQCVGETAFRFRMYTPGNEHPFDNSIYQLEGQNGVNITENEEFISISKGKIEARVRKYPWEVSYYLDGKLKTKEQIKDSNVDNMCKNLPVGFTYDENKEIIGVNETMYLYADEEFYGFGEKFTDFGKRGQTINCWQTDALSTNTEKSYKNHPFFMSSRGYAILLNTYTRSKFEMGSFSNVAYNMSVEDKVLDYVIWMYYSCAVYISTCVYEKYQTKGQSILNVVQLGLGAIVGNLVGGKLIRLLGYEKGYLLMAGITTLMTICALIVYFWKNREQRNGGDVCEI